MYMAEPSYTMRTAVDSETARPSSGSLCTRPDTSTADCHAGSSSRPSTTGERSTRTADTVGTARDPSLPWAGSGSAPCKRTVVTDSISMRVLPESHTQRGVGVPGVTRQLGHQVFDVGEHALESGDADLFQVRFAAPLPVELRAHAHPRVAAQPQPVAPRDCWT